MSVKNEQDLKIIERIFLDYFNELSKTESEVKCSSLSKNKQKKVLEGLSDNNKFAIQIYNKVEKWFKGENINLFQKETSFVYHILAVVNGKIAQSRNVFTVHDDGAFEIWFKELTDRINRNDKTLNSFIEQYRSEN